jgi:cell division protein FtsX
MRYFEKGQKLGWVTLQETIVWTDAEYVVRMVLATIIVIAITLFLAAIFIGPWIFLLLVLFGII